MSAILRSRPEPKLLDYLSSQLVGGSPSDRAVVLVVKLY